MRILIALFSLLTSFAVAKRGGKENNDRKIFFKTQLIDVTHASRLENVRLECQAGGSPSPTIHWLKNGERIIQGQSTDLRDDEAFYEEKAMSNNQMMLGLGKVRSRLYLDCASAEDEAEYTCVAETPYERITQTTFLMLDDELDYGTEDTCITKKAFRGEPARIHLWTAVRLEYEGATVQLYCRGSGYPLPKCMWSKRPGAKNPINDDEYNQILPNGDLLISDITWQRNMGGYYCRCENEAGADEVSTFLYPTVL